MSRDFVRKGSQMKNCPFCGSDHLGTVGGCYDSGGGWGIETVKVKCYSCGGSGPECEGKNKVKKALEAWDRRTENASS